MRRALLLPLALCLAACADNAILEVELDLPMAATSAPQYAYVQSRSAAAIDFDGDWAGADAPEGFLLTSASSMQNVSFVTSNGATMTQPLGIRVRFCSDRVCGAIADTHAQEAHFVITRAFYRGKRTNVRLTVTPSATPTTTTIDRCHVAGCTTGTATSYCYGDMGAHFCE